MIRYVKVRGSTVFNCPADYITNYRDYNIFCDIYERKQRFLYDRYVLRLEGKERDVKNFLDYLQIQELYVEEIE